MGDTGLDLNGLDDNTIPSRLCIIARIEPLYEPSDTTVTLIENDTRYASTYLYSNGVVCIGIRLVLTGYETDDRYVDVQEDITLFECRFKYEHESRDVYVHMPTETRGLYWDDTQCEREPVFAWGGYYQKGCDLAQIQQHLYSVSTDMLSTTIHTHQKIPEQMICVAPDLSLSSLEDSIVFGDITFTLPDLDDTCGYQSSDVHGYDRKQERIKIHCIRRS
jgi:hypothetical protein